MKSCLKGIISHRKKVLFPIILLTFASVMDWEAFKKHQVFAGPTKPSMHRRRVGHDYQSRRIYLITMTVEGRRPLLGSLVGEAHAAEGSEDAPRIVATELGRRVGDCWWDIARYYPDIKPLALQLMPDHLHGILFVKEKMEKPLGIALRGFKQSCNRHYRELGVAPVQSVALTTQQTGQTGQMGHTGQTGRQVQRRDRRGEDRTHGLLFARGYNDRLLLRSGQLETWLRYLEDNPRRLLMKRENPDLFRVQRNVEAAGITFSAIGNRFLLDRLFKVQVQCSRSLTEHEIDAKVAECLGAARQGAVLVSPSISPGEKAVMKAAFNEGLPLIYLQENGFTHLAKPGGARMEACARGQLLILAPWEHHNEKIAIKRGQCLTLNDMARRLCDQ